MLPYRPHPLLRNGHLQTLMLGIVYGKSYPYDATPIEVKFDDGERTVVHEENGTPLAADAPLAILIHGLGGSHQSNYLQRIAHDLRLRGIRTWRLDLRGSGSGIRLASRPANAGSSEDLAAVVCTACRIYPAASIHIVGFSLGGNILLKMLGEAAADGPLAGRVALERIDSALAVAPPINLHDCATNMDRRSRGIYTRYYLKVLNRQVEQRREIWDNWKSIDPWPAVKTIRQFDERYTAPLCGYRDTNHYYDVASADQWLPAIRTPTRILMDRDDPIVTCSSMNRCRFAPGIVDVEYTRHGGHLGYYGLDANLKSIRWMDHYVVEYLTSAARMHSVSAPHMLERHAKVGQHA